MKLVLGENQTRDYSKFNGGAVEAVSTIEGQHLSTTLIQSQAYQNVTNHIFKRQIEIITIPIDLTQIIKVGGCTFLSRVIFSFTGSWHLKVDVDEKANVGIYLCERGDLDQELPNDIWRGLNDKNHHHKAITSRMSRTSTPLNFLSTMVKFSVQDPMFQKDEVFAFSFSKNQHQVVGKSNFLNVNQLQNKKKLEITIWIDEFNLHSSLIHYFANSFEDLISVSKPEMAESVYDGYYESRRSDSGGRKARRKSFDLPILPRRRSPTSSHKYDRIADKPLRTPKSDKVRKDNLFDICFSDIRSLLDSNHLNVNDELLVLDFFVAYI